MAANYKGLEFPTPLIAQWAAFFDLAGWQWSSGITPVENWKPDFRIIFPCGHSECSGTHTVLIAVLAVDDIAGVKGHPALTHSYDVCGTGKAWIADAGAVFGIDPWTTYWVMSHGDGGGVEDVTQWTNDAGGLWQKAKELVSIVSA
jgi:hypothetical protein